MPWAEAWKGIKKGQIAVALDPSWLLGKLQPMLAGRPAGAGSPFDGFEPLLSKAHGYAVGVEVVQGVRVDGIASCNTDPGAKQVADTIRAGLTLARNTLASFRGPAARDGQPEAAKILLDIADPVLEAAEVKVEGRTVHLTATSALKSGQFAAALAPAFQAQRSTARRMQSTNNMKQLGLAFHNYAQVNKGQFPTSVMIGPDGKTPYSWRIAVLPYLEQNDLYKQYNFNEPWDGPNNRKLLDKMPVIFHHPDGDGKSSSYYLPVNAHAVGSPQPSDIAKMTDGLSNTILLVEARREIPWTKPEDIPVPVPTDGPDAPLPKLGGFSTDGYNAAFADGAVKFLKDSIDPETLKALFSKDGGELMQAQ